MPNIILSLQLKYLEYDGAVLQDKYEAQIWKGGERVCFETILKHAFCAWAMIDDWDGKPSEFNSNIHYHCIRIGGKCKHIQQHNPLFPHLVYNLHKEPSQNASLNECNMVMYKNQRSTSCMCSHLSSTL